MTRVDFDRLNPPPPPGIPQFIAVEFRPGGRRYTYRNDGETLAIGDLIKVEVRGGVQTVTVAELVIEEPPFECKPVLGRADIPQENENAR